MIGAGCVPCSCSGAQGAAVEGEGVTDHKDSALWARLQLLRVEACDSSSSFFLLLHCEVGPMQYLDDLLGIIGYRLRNPWNDAGSLMTRRTSLQLVLMLQTRRYDLGWNSWLTELCFANRSVTCCYDNLEFRACCKLYPIMRQTCSYTCAGKLDRSWSVNYSSVQALPQIRFTWMDLQCLSPCLNEKSQIKFSCAASWCNSVKCKTGKCLEFEPCLIFLPPETPCFWCWLESFQWTSNFIVIKVLVTKYRLLP